MSLFFDEEDRQKLFSDGDYVKSEIYFFEIEIPAAGVKFGKKINAITPLLISPQSITMQEPYAVTPTATVGGGLYVEEDGVIARQLSIQGTTGFRPRAGVKQNTGNDFGVNIDALNLSEPLSYDPRPTPIAPFAQLSGQRQFQYLQDKIFRLYSDLKQNPDTAAGTRLFFHNPKDGEHWQVIPLSFTMSRAVPRSTMYMYDIQLLVVEKANLNKATVVRPTDTLTAIRQAAQDIRKGISKIEGAISNVKNAINEISNAVGEIAGTFKSIGNIFSALDGVLNSARELVSGTVTALGSPLFVIKDILDSVSNAVDAIEDYGGLREGIYNLQGTFIFLEKSANELTVALNNFDATNFGEGPLSQVGNNFNPSATSVSGLSSPTSVQAILNQGTGNQVGDAVRDAADPVDPNPLGSINGLSITTELVFQSDTILTLAARVLGDLSRTPEIIALNRLRPPYISNTGLPGTVRPGDEVLVPASGRAPVDKLGPTVYGATREDSLEEKLFGVDMKLDPVDGVVGFIEYDLVLANNSEDIQLRGGIDNLKQGLRTRLLTELGADPLFPEIGYQQFIGLNTEGAENAILNLSLQSAVEADERITSITNLKTEQPTPDSFVVEFDAAVYNIQDNVQMRVVT